MIQRVRTARPADERGFTLIELLVVIIVLGILAAVVVFAVTGVGDKGKSAAVSIDARTIKTAEETFCSQNGRYGTAAQLVAANLLSGVPSYNQIFLDTTYGPCGNTSYQVFTTPAPSGLAALPAGVCTAGTWCSGPSATGAVLSPTVLTSAGNRNVVSSNYPSGVVLPSGRLLVGKNPSTTTGASSATSAPVLPFQVFDPAGGVMGKWSDLAAPNTSGATTGAGAVPNLVTTGAIGNFSRQMLVLKGGPSLCGLHCGKVLVKITASTATGVWKLFDENDSEPPANVSLGRWTTLSTTAPTFSVAGTPGGGGPYRRQFYGNAIQLLRSPCGALCGKVLVVGQGNENGFSTPGTPADPEIWDPLDNNAVTGGFRKLGLETGYQEYLQTPAGDCNIPGAPGANTCTSTGDDRAPTLTPLDDGKVLMVSGQVGQLFDPVTQKFTTIPGPPFNHSASKDHVQRLPDKSFLFTANSYTGVSVPPRAMVFTPAPGGGTWTQVPNCGDGAAPDGMGGAGANTRCHLVATLPNGKILAKRTSSDTRGPTSQAPYVFDTTQIGSPGGPWAAISTAPITSSPTTVLNWGFMLPEVRPGSCGNLCGKVMAIGSAVTGMTGAPTAFYSP